MFDVIAHAMKLNFTILKVKSIKNNYNGKLFEPDFS